MNVIIHVKKTTIKLHVQTEMILLTNAAVILFCISIVHIFIATFTSFASDNVLQLSVVDLAYKTSL